MKLRLFPLLAMLAACGGPAGDPPKAPGQPASPDSTVTALADTLRDGHQRIRDSKGMLLMEGDMRNGRRQGLWTAYHPSGTVASRNVYVEGVLHGPTSTFRPNGALYYQGQHGNGHPVGTWEFHDEIGTLVRTVEYDSTGTEIKRH